jgi:hypothetical protein
LIQCERLNKKEKEEFTLHEMGVVHAVIPALQLRPQGTNTAEMSRPLTPEN